MNLFKKAKANGVYKGRKTSVDRRLVQEIRDSGLGASAIARQLNCDRSSVYRVLR